MDLGPVFPAGAGGISIAQLQANLTALACPRAHTAAVPVDDLTGELVAWLCPDCDQQLPADWKPAPIDVARVAVHEHNHHGRPDFPHPRLPTLRPGDRTVTPDEVPDDLVQIAANALAENSLLWGAWERQQTEEQARAILAAVLPLYKRKLYAHGVFANLQRSLDALPDKAPPPPPPPPRHTILVAETHQHINYWCHHNRRNPRDQTIIRIVNGLYDATRNLMGLTDFELVVLSPCQDYDEVMALITQRQSMHRKGSTQ